MKRIRTVIVMLSAPMLGLAVQTPLAQAIPITGGFSTLATATGIDLQPPAAGGFSI
jgi:hypothetical protein